MKFNLLVLIFLISNLCFSQNKSYSKIIHQNWVNNNWENLSQSTYSYNSFGDLDSLSQFLWSTSNLNYDIINKSIYYYNSTSDIDSIISYQIKNGNWEKYAKQTYSYNSNGLTDSVYSYLYKSNSWKLYSSIAYLYNASGLIINMQTNLWDTISKNWNSFSNQDLYYNNLNKIDSTILKTHKNGSWINYYKSKYNYSNNDSLALISNQIWDTINNFWSNHTKTNYYYVSLTNLDSSITYVWDNNNNQWNKTTKYIYEYKSTNATNNSSCVNSFPYEESFENGTSDWLVSGKDLIWNIGTPNTSSIDTAFDGVKCWATNLNNHYSTNQLSVLESPCFDISAFSKNIVVQFALKSDTEFEKDGVILEYTFDNLNWNLFEKTDSALNWYNSKIKMYNNSYAWTGKNDWLQTQNYIPHTTNQGYIKFRFTFFSDNNDTKQSGFAIDKFVIYEDTLSFYNTTSNTFSSGSYTFNDFCQDCDCRYTNSIFDSVIVHKDVTYATSPSFWFLPTDLKMDIYEPHGDTLKNRPVMIWLHSGAFVLGDKNHDDMIALCDSFARKGYVTASIQYRKGFNAFGKSGAQRTAHRGMQDISAAIRYLIEFNSTYGVDSNNIFIGGSSAGAVLTLYSAFIQENQRFQSTYGGWFVNDLGCIDCEGNSYKHQVKPKGYLSFWGAVEDSSMRNIEDSIPLLLMQGTEDWWVPYNVGKPFHIPFFPKSYGSLPLSIRSKNLNLPTTFIPLKGIGHEPHSDLNGNFKKNPPTAYWDTMLYEITKFTYNNLMPNTTFQLSGDQTANKNDIKTYVINSKTSLNKVKWRVENGYILHSNQDTIKVKWTGGKGVIKATEINKLGACGITKVLSVNIVAGNAGGGSLGSVEDISINKLVSPVSGCENLTNTEKVTIEITNNGTTGLSNFDLSYNLNGTVITETYVGTLKAGQTTTYTFNKTADLSQTGNYSLKAQVVGAVSVASSNNSNISNNAKPSVFVTKIDNKCENQTNGKAQIFNNNTQNLTYSWSNGQTSDIASNLADGNYTVTVTNAQNCSVIEKVSITSTPFVYNLPIKNIKECGVNSVDVDAGNGMQTYYWSNGAITQTATFAQSGKYQITVTNQNGCTATDEVEIVVENPTITLGNDTAICATETLTLDAGNTFASYVWNTSETSNTIESKDFQKIGIHTYTVEATTQNGCIAKASINVQVENCVATSIAENTENTISIYPNPSNGGNVFIKFEGNESYKVEVLDLQGRLVYKNNFYNNLELLTLNLEPSTYFVKIYTQNSVKTERLIVK